MREILVPNISKLTYPNKNQIVRQENLGKVISTIQKCNGKVFSIELCPNRDIDFVLLERLQPTFCSVTWHYKITNYQQPVPVQEIPAIVLAKCLIQCGLQVLLHLTAANLNSQIALNILTCAKNIGIKNIFVIHGDSSDLDKNTKPTFLHAVDLVKFIKSYFGDYFSIGVAGYPKNISNLDEKEFFYLKEKVNSGADFIITQAIFEVESFLIFSKICNQFNINIPIIPATYIFQSSEGLQKMSTICKVKIPCQIQTQVTQLQKDTNAIKRYSSEYFKEIFLKLYSTNVCCIHIFSLNNFQMIENVFSRLGFNNKIEKPI